MSYESLKPEHVLALLAEVLLGSWTVDDTAQHPWSRPDKERLAFSCDNSLLLGILNYVRVTFVLVPYTATWCPSLGEGNSRGRFVWLYRCGMHSLLSVTHFHSSRLYVTCSKINVRRCLSISHLPL